MGARQIRVAGLVVSVLLAGCLVIPREHTYPTQIEIDGVLLDNGTPVAGAVVVSNGLLFSEHCGDEAQRTITDADGRFHFDGASRTSKWEVVPLAPSSPTYYPSICLLEETGLRPLFRGRFWAVAPEHIELICDVAHPNEAAGSICSAVPTGEDYETLERRLEQSARELNETVP
jgi:hypothetical protein